MKSFSRNAEQVHSPSSISLLLGECRGVHTYMFDIGAYGRSTARMYGCSIVCTYRVVRCICTGVVSIRAYKFTDTGVLTNMYIISQKMWTPTCTGVVR